MGSSAPPKTKKKKLLFVLLITILAAGSYWIWLQPPAVDQPPPAKAAKAIEKVRVVPVELVEARLGKIPERLLVTGSLKPKETVDVKPKITGRIRSIAVNVGDFVREGQLLATLEDDELRQQYEGAKAAVRVAQASLSQRQSELARAKAELQRAEALKSEGLISERDYETLKTNYEVIQAQLQLAQAQLRQAETQLAELELLLEQTKIYAPISGHIGERYVDVGALVNPNTPIVRVVNIGVLVTAANVPEENIGRVRVGTPAIVHVDAYGEKEFRGKVVRVAPVLDESTRSARVEIEIPNPQFQLKAEMFARVELDLGTTRETVVIPREALVYRGQQPGVFILDANRPIFQPVQAGSSSGDVVEILANLAPGTKVVGRGAAMLREGDQVRIVKGQSQLQGGEVTGIKEPFSSPAGDSTRTPNSQADPQRQPASNLAGQAQLPTS